MTGKKHYPDTEFRVEMIQESDLAGMRDTWNQLLSCSQNSSVFMRHEWIYSWWQVFKKKKSLFTFAIYNKSGELIAIAPLFIEKQNYKIFQLKFLKILGSNQVEPDYLCLIIKPGYENDALDQIIKFIIKNGSKWDVISFENITISDNTSLIEILKRHQFAIHIDKSICPYIKLPADFDEYLGRFKHKRRNKLKSYVERIRKNFEYEFSIAVGDNAHNILNELFELHKLRADSIDRNTKFITDQVIEFHQTVVKAMQESGIIRLLYVKLNGKIESCLYTFLYHQKFYFYQSGYNPDFNDYSLGNVMLLNTIQYSIENNCQIFDFLKGDETYKSMWADSAQPIMSLIAVPHNFSALIFFMLLKIRRKAGKIKRRISYI